MQLELSRAQTLSALHGINFVTQAGNDNYIDFLSAHMLLKLQLKNQNEKKTDEQNLDTCFIECSIVYTVA